MGCTPKKHNERFYQTELCSNLDGEMEVLLQDRTRVDCLTDEYAIEVDFAKKWAESIGQSLYYGYMTHKKPAIALIVNLPKEQRYLQRVDAICKKYNIKLYLIKK
jgi:hypothetical protein